MEINKTDTLPDVILTTGNCPTLPFCGKEGVVLCVLRSRDIEDDDVSSDLSTILILGVFKSVLTNRFKTKKQ